MNLHVHKFVFYFVPRTDTDLVMHSGAFVSIVNAVLCWAENNKTNDAVRLRKMAQDQHSPNSCICALPCLGGAPAGEAYWFDESNQRMHLDVMLRCIIGTRLLET